MHHLQRQEVGGGNVSSGPPGGASTPLPGPSIPPPPTDGRGEFNDHLVGAILVTIFCCTPLGIPAIVYAALAKSKFDAGNIAGAWREAETAGGFMWGSFWVGLIVGGLLILATLAD
jgi:hypothetical protein